MLSLDCRRHDIASAEPGMLMQRASDTAATGGKPRNWDRPAASAVPAYRREELAMISRYDTGLGGWGYLLMTLNTWDRFTGASIDAYLGLVPCEYSSGSSRRLGGITKAGNSHVRRLLVEAAWHHKPRYTIGKVLKARWDQAPAAARTRAHAGNQRLHQRWPSYSQRTKRHTVANTAIARELAGWCWSLATLPD